MQILLLHPFVLFLVEFFYELFVHEEIFIAVIKPIVENEFCQETEILILFELSIGLIWNYTFHFVVIYGILDCDFDFNDITLDNSIERFDLLIALPEFLVLETYFLYHVLMVFNFTVHFYWLLVRSNNLHQIE